MRSSHSNIPHPTERWNYRRFVGSSGLLALALSLLGGVILDDTTSAQDSLVSGELDAFDGQSIFAEPDSPMDAPVAVAPVPSTGHDIVDFNPWQLQRPRRYLEAEYLLWWAGHSTLPALVTTNPAGTSINDAGLLSSPSSSVLYGNDTVGDWPHSGLRLRGGQYADDKIYSRLELDVMFLFEGTETFRSHSVGGDPILARPFANARTGADDAQLLSYPGIVNGQLQSQYKRNALGIDPLVFFCLSSSQCRWLEFFTGFRFFYLRDSIELNERADLPAGGAIGPGTYFQIKDEFTATNIYTMVPLGLSWSGNRGKWIWNLRGDIGLGIVNQQVNVKGSTDTYVNDVLDSHQDAGLLALWTNRGHHKRTRFAWVPQLAGNLRRQLSDKTSLQLGYTLMYLDNAVKAVDHLPTSIDPDNLPTPIPGGGPDPQFAFQESSIWVHGFNFGLQYQY